MLATVVGARSAQERGCWWPRRASRPTGADRGRSNEDFVGAVPGAVVVVDGAFLPGVEGVCRHGVAWYAHRLGGTLLGELGHGDDRSLPALLTAAIERVTDQHRPTCDTAHPWSPWAPVALVRLRAGREVVISESYLPALAAARDEEERSRVLAELRGRRNHRGGFWVAKDDPRAAAEAVTGVTAVAEVREAERRHAVAQDDATIAYCTRLDG